MIRTGAAVMLLCAAVTASPSDCEEWQLLFDGHSTSHWEEVTGKPFPAAAWKVEDGCLRTVPGADGVQDIRTLQTFGSFELVWEWKVTPGANSGVKYFIRRVDQWAAKTGKGYQARGRGAEYQIADDSTDRDAASSATKSTGSLYGRMAPIPGKHLRPPGEFNESRVIVRGAEVEHWLNGEKILSYHEDAPIDTPIVLQNHNSVVYFRNIRVRELCD